MTIGTVAILNVAAGDTKLTFDPSNPAEVKRSATIVKDMIRRGFVLLVEVGADEKGPIYRRAHDFDETTAEYIVAGSSTPEEDEESHEQEPASTPRPRRQGTAKREPAKRRRISASASNVVAVARTAGG